jgi:hypothetical protein
MPQRRTESRYLKQSGRRASSSGVGGRSYAVEELLASPELSQALVVFRELSSTRRISVDDALRFAIQRGAPALYGRISALGDEDHTTFRSKLRLYKKSLDANTQKT